MAKGQFLLYNHTLSVGKYGFCVFERCFALKHCLISAQHCKLLDENGLSFTCHAHLYLLSVCAFIPLRCPPPLLSILMYLKCLLHNLCLINNCFKGCDTTLTQCFSLLVLLCHVCKCFTLNRATFMYVCFWVNISIFTKLLITVKSHKKV